jgi:hypothetical protein
MVEVLELYCRVVESVVADPEQTLSELTTLPRKEGEVSADRHPLARRTRP